MRTQPSEAVKLLAAVTVSCAAFYAPASHALALGQLRVLSALGEPLVAEVDVPQISAEELAAFRAGVASPSEFEAAGMAFNPSLRGASLNLFRRPDGRVFLRLTSAQPVNDPYIELLLQARGGGAQAVLRDYTLLFQPRTPQAAGNLPPVALGQARVLSARGEPLRAEIDVPQLTAAQAANVRAGMGSPADFQTAGMSYSPSLQDVRFTFQQRPDGRLFLSLTSERPVNEPSLELILEANSSSGRTVRDYTLPLAAPSPVPVVAAARVSAGPVTAVEPAAAPVAEPVPATGPVPAPAAVAPESVAIAAPVAVRPPVVAPESVLAPALSSAEPSKAEPAAPRQVKVRAGDTASRIARANKPAEISLDQMLLALLRANPDAFIDGNVNLLRAGASLTLPTEDQAAAVAPGEATETLALQSRNFDEYRRKLAADAQRMTATSRQAAGKLEVDVVESKRRPPGRNKLTLSAGALASAQEKSIAARLARVAEERAAKLASEIKALSRLQGTNAEGASAPTGTAVGSQAR
jgi:pilus assembly protein FimV